VTYQLDLSELGNETDESSLSTNDIHEAIMLRLENLNTSLDSASFYVTIMMYGAVVLFCLVFCLFLVKLEFFSENINVCM